MNKRGVPFKRRLTKRPGKKSVIEGRVSFDYRYLEDFKVVKNATSKSRSRTNNRYFLAYKASERWMLKGVKAGDVVRIVTRDDQLDEIELLERSQGFTVGLASFISNKIWFAPLWYKDGLQDLYTATSPPGSLKKKKVLANAPTYIETCVLLSDTDSILQERLKKYGRAFVTVKYPPMYSAVSRFAVAKKHISKGGKRVSKSQLQNANKQSLTPHQRTFVAEFIEFLGAENDVQAINTAYLKSCNIGEPFPDSVEQVLPKAEIEEEKLLQMAPEVEETPFVTIDGLDAKDFDDAIWCAKLKKGYRLITAIADVSYYVKPDSAIDLEARERSSSVYLPQKVVPMLPQVLSNELCSLVPQKVRRAFLCEMQFDENGKRLTMALRFAKIRSERRLNYEQINEWIDDKSTQSDAESIPLAVADSLSAALELAEKLRLNRIEQGALLFTPQEYREIQNTPDTVNKLEAVLSPPPEKITSERLIEEVMIATNVAVANELQTDYSTAIYRYHPQPTVHDWNELCDVVAHLGFGDILSKVNPNGPSHLHETAYAEIQQLMEAITDSPMRELIITSIIRVSGKAKFSTQAQPHFGLGEEAYSYFTSPIRRYPDLLLHQALAYRYRNSFKGDNSELDPQIQPFEEESLPRILDDCNNKELLVDALSRAVVLYNKLLRAKAGCGGEVICELLNVTERRTELHLPEYDIKAFVQEKVWRTRGYELDENRNCISMFAPPRKQRKNQGTKKDTSALTSNRDTSKKAAYPEEIKGGGRIVMRLTHVFPATGRAWIDFIDG